jgi:RNA polymerase sigma-70 factor (ECF subfamily)
MRTISNDAELLDCLKRGDALAFDHVYSLYFKPLCYFAEKITGDSASAEDIATESFVKLLQKNPDFETLWHLKSFLYTSTRNACLDLLRMRKRHDQTHSEIKYLAQLSEEATESAVIMAEVLQAIYTAIDHLPDKCKGVVKLALIEGLDNEQIAAETGMTYQTVRNYKSEGIKLLRLSLFKNSGLSSTAIFCCLLYVGEKLQ